MATHRSYRDNCGMAHALDLIGERWALLVVRELLFGPKRFSDLKRDLPGISTNMLTDRLTELENAGVLGRHQLPPPANVRVYELTAWGAGLEEVVTVIGRWGASSPQLPTDHHVSAATAMMSLRTNVDLAGGSGRHRLAFRFGAESFVADAGDGRFEVDRGAPRPGDLVLTTDPAVLAGMLYGGLDPAVALASGAIELDVAADDPAPGSDPEPTPDERVQRLREFLRLFHLPAPATV